MIVFKNPFRESKFDTSTAKNDLVTIRFKDFSFVTARSNKKMFKKLRIIACKKIKSCSPKTSKKEIIEKRKEPRSRYFSFHNYPSTVYRSNYDNEDMYEDFDYESNREFLYSSFHDSEFNFFKNNMFEMENLFPEIEEKSNKYKELLNNQLKLIIKGYDIIIPDFMIKSMMEIAESINFQELIEAMKPLKAEMEDFENYDRFSELELLETLQNSLINIDENCIDKTSIFQSLYAYIGKEIFKEAISNLLNIYPEKYDLFSKLSYELYNEKPSSYGPRFHYDSAKSPFIHTNGDDLIPIIANDDVDQFQKIYIQHQCDFSKITIDLLKNTLHKGTYLLARYCNPIECSAFYGSIKCFKFLLLNTQLMTKDTIKYAIFGGNTEIIHLCESDKNCNFDGTLKVAFHCYRDNIAKWILDNKKEQFKDEHIKDCLYVCNYNMISYLLDFHEYCSKKEKIIKYFLYVTQKIKIDNIYGFVKYSSNFPIIEYANENGLIYCSKDKIKLLCILLPKSLDLDDEKMNVLNIIVFFLFLFTILIPF